MNARRLLLDDASERRDAGLRFDAVDQVGVVDVPRGEVGQGAAALVFELDQRRAPRPDRDGLVATAERLQLGLLVGAHHVLVGTQPLALEDPGVEIERAAVLVREVPVSREDPRPGLWVDPLFEEHLVDVAGDRQLILKLPDPPPGGRQLECLIIAA